MLKSIIDELYYAFGELVLEPEPSEFYHELRAEEKLYFEELGKFVGEEHKEWVMGFVDLRNDIEEELEKTNFRRGFKLAIKLILEAISNDKNFDLAK